MTCKTEVIKAIEFKRPSYIPRWFVNKDYEISDIANYWLFPLGKGEVTEWGYKWEHTREDKGTMGMPKEPLIPSWEAMKDYRFPDPYSIKKFNEIQEFKVTNKDKYQIASMGISGFNTYIFLRGFQNALIDFYIKDKRALKLMDDIMDIENSIIRKASEYGFDGIIFYDDWGMQKNIFISPSLWREIFKPRYKKQFDNIHNLNMHAWFHSCGDVTEIIPDFNQIGLDVINIGQPNVVDIDKISALLRGKQCFLMPISYQTVSISGTKEDIKKEALHLYNKLATSNGGLIGWIEEYSSIGMPLENYDACAAAFKELL
jgi:uroporphyrinogen decarboxylase